MGREIVIVCGREGYSYTNTSEPSAISMRFYAELNDFLPLENRFKEIRCTFFTNLSVKDVIEKLGVLHAEVDLILVNGHSVNFDYVLQNGDRVAVYPMFETLDISSITKVRVEPLREPAFILDVHLGRLAKYLRMLGFNTLYNEHYQDQEIINLAKNEFIILTRDKGLLRNVNVTHGYWVRAIKPKLQVKEILSHFDLFSKINPFTRCLECNSELQRVDKKTIKHLLLDETKKYYSDFLICYNCNKIYWPGSHYSNMKEFIMSLISDQEGPSHENIC